MRVTESQLSLLNEQPVNLSLANAQKATVDKALEELRQSNPDVALRATNALNYIWATVEHLNRNAMASATGAAAPAPARPQQPGVQPRA